MTDHRICAKIYADFDVILDARPEGGQMYGSDLLTRNICENESILRKYRAPVIVLPIGNIL